MLGYSTRQIAFDKGVKSKKKKLVSKSYHQKYPSMVHVLIHIKDQKNVIYILRTGINCRTIRRHVTLLLLCAQFTVGRPLQYVISRQICLVLVGCMCRAAPFSFLHTDTLYCSRLFVQDQCVTAIFLNSHTNKVELFAR